jgi:hypothetical protein
MPEEELKKLIKENKRLNEEMLEQLHYIKRYVVFQQVFSVVKIFLIVIPIILGVIYLPPLLDKVIENYSQFFDLYGFTQAVDGSLFRIILGRG